MKQFEYNDLNKFFVSIGVFLIGFTFFLPWLFLREDFDLLITQSDLQTYTEKAQGIIRQRQSITSLLPFVVFIISSLSFILGLFLCIIGIIGWRKLQKSNLKLENLKIETQQLTNKKLTQEVEAYAASQKLEVTVSEYGNNEPVEALKDSITSDGTIGDPIEVPINNTWVLNHWGSNCASIVDGHMIFTGPTRLESDGCHTNLYNFLKVGSVYEISCFVKSTPGTTGMFQLWCHDKIGNDMIGSQSAIPYATPSEEGEICKLRFEAKYNPNMVLHLQYMPGTGSIDVSDVRIVELKMP